jgi:hypothetical protein
MCAVGDRPTRAQRRCDENGFGNLRIRRACLSRVVRMNFDAIGALSLNATATAISSLHFFGIAPSAKKAFNPSLRYMNICCCTGSATPDCGRLSVFSIFLRQCRSSYRDVISWSIFLPSLESSGVVQCSFTQCAKAGSKNILA